MRSARLWLCAVPILRCVPGGSRCSIEIAGNPLHLRRIPVLPCVFVLTKGMSLIGPRPERPAFCHEFEKRIHGWNYRTLVRPGISDLAQVTDGYDLLPKEKVVLDLYKSRCRAIIN